MAEAGRVVRLRAGENGRYLRAYVDEQGRLHLDAEDVGPEIAVVTARDSYEYFKTIAADDVPRVCTLLGGDPDDDILDLLERDWRGQRTDELEQRLRDSDIEVELFVY